MTINKSLLNTENKRELRKGFIFSAFFLTISIISIFMFIEIKNRWCINSTCDAPIEIIIIFSAPTFLLGISIFITTLFDLRREKVFGTVFGEKDPEPYGALLFIISVVTLLSGALNLEYPDNKIYFWLWIFSTFVMFILFDKLRKKHKIK